MPSLTSFNVHSVNHRRKPALKAASGLLSNGAYMDTVVRAFACKKVWEDSAPVLRVCHDADGTWQFLCGGDDHTTPDEAVVIHAQRMFDLRPELIELASPESGFSLSRHSTAVQ
jgi:hypothetical protein